MSKTNANPKQTQIPKHKSQTNNSDRNFDLEDK